MKVKFKYGIGTYSGTLDEMTYGSYRNGAVCVGRKWVYPTPTAQNATMGERMKNLSKVYAGASAGYKEDLSVYCLRYEKQHVAKNKLAPSSYAIFVKMMFAWSKATGGLIDLSTVTVEDIQSSTEGAKTIAEAVENGHLASVREYAILTTTI